MQETPYRFDAGLLAVSRDLTISIAPPLLAASPDRPATHQAVSKLHGTALTVVPALEDQRMDFGRLAVWFAKFQRRWSVVSVL